MNTRRRHVKTWLVLLLQCIPLLGAAGCAANGVSNQAMMSSGGGILELLWLSVFLWGLGYAYLRTWGRFVAVFILGPVFALTSCTGTALGARVDYEHFSRYTDDANTIASANMANIEEALIILAAVTLLAVDAWRLALARNRENSESAEPAPVTSLDKPFVSPPLKVRRRAR